jgi:hypothetical protein
LRYLLQVVQTQTTTAYCRILPTLDHHVWDIFFRLFRHKPCTTAYCIEQIPTLDHCLWDIFFR